MKTILTKVAAVTALLMFCGLVNANSVSVTWHEPEKYTDVKGANESDKRYRQQVFKQYEKHIAKLAESLPENATVELTIKDLNLAGDVRYNFSLHREIRMVERLHWPRIKFDYKLMSDGQVVDKGEVVLKDMSFMDRAGMMRNSHSHNSLKYDLYLLTRWFSKELEPALAQYEKQQNAVMSE